MERCRGKGWGKGEYPFRYVYPFRGIFPALRKEELRC
jgi:hypothetical protein